MPISTSPGQAIVKTLLRNASQTTRFFGFVPPHGKWMEPGERVEITGDYLSALSKRRLAESQAFLEAVAEGIAVVDEIPFPFETGDFDLSDLEGTDEEPEPEPEPPEGPGGVTVDGMTWYRMEDVTGANGATITQLADHLEGSLVIGGEELSEDFTDPTVALPGINDDAELRAIEMPTSPAQGFLTQIRSIASNTALLDSVSEQTQYTIFAVVELETATGGLLDVQIEDEIENVTQLSLSRITASSSNHLTAISDPAADGSPRNLHLGPATILYGGTATARLLSLEVDHTAGTVTLYVDGVLWGRSHALETGAPIESGVFLWGLGVLTKMGDLVTYPTILDTEDRHTVEDTLATKFGITVRRLPALTGLVCYFDGGIGLSAPSTPDATYQNWVDGEYVGAIRDAITPANAAVQTDVASANGETRRIQGRIHSGLGGLKLNWVSGNNTDWYEYLGVAAPPVTGDITMVVGFRVPATRWDGGANAFSANHYLLEWRTINSTNEVGIQVALHTSGAVRLIRGNKPSTYTRHLLTTAGSVLTTDQNYLLVARWVDGTLSWDRLLVNGAVVAGSATTDSTAVNDGVTRVILNNRTTGQTDVLWNCGMIFTRALSNDEMDEVYQYFKKRLSGI